MPTLLFPQTSQTVACNSYSNSGYRTLQLFMKDIQVPGDIVTPLHNQEVPFQRPTSFNGRTIMRFPLKHHQIRQPEAQPEAAEYWLVNVTVQRSPWPVWVMASTDWRVENLVAVVLRLYAKEGRWPPLLSASLLSVQPRMFGSERNAD
ncbi:unnamed protein product [Musa banksii]